MGAKIEKAKRVLRALMMVVIWVSIGALTFILIRGGSKHRAEQVVTKMVVKVADSTSRGNLVNTSVVKQLISAAKIKTVGQPIEKVPLSLIEDVVSRNGFVKEVVSYTNYSGELHIDIFQRSAAARLLLNGYNCYISPEGYTFKAPRSTSLYVPVITGSYRPIFPPGYVGNIDTYTAAEIEKLELEIAKIERERYPLYHRETENNEDKRSVRRRYINRSMFESKDAFERRIVEVREENRKLRELYAYRQRVIDDELRAIDKRQEVLRDKQKKLQKNCDDIHNLLIFVEMIEEDPFWSSEIVQIVLSSNDDGMMNIAMEVRSGKFSIDFGSLMRREDYIAEPEVLSDNSATIRSLLPSVTTSRRIREEKARKERVRQEELVRDVIESRMDRLQQFYKDALPRVGWDRYKRISVEFDNQVVCKS